MARKRKENRRANNSGSLTKRTYTRADGSTYNRWEARVTVGYNDQGKPRRKTVYGDSQAEAIAKMQALQQQLSAGTYADTDKSVNAYLDQWLRHKERDVKARTAHDYRYTLEHYVMPHMERVKLAKLRPLHIQAMMNEVAEAVSPDRANKARRVLHTALTQAVRWQILPRNPADAITPMKHERQEMILWAPEEVTRFLATSRPHRLYAAFYLDLSTGLRCGELLGLRWDDIEGKALRVRRSLVHVGGKLHISTPKTKKGERHVALSQDVLDVLAEHKRKQDAERAKIPGAWANSELVFPSVVGTYIHPRNLLRTFYGLVEAARAKWRADAEQAGDFETVKRLDDGKLMRRIRLHDLRHLHASIAIKEGMDAKMLADRLGHTRASFTLDVYTHLFDEQRASSAVSIAHLAP